jgi:predicted lipopolysaccharide heptosyltransferase III
MIKILLIRLSSLGDIIMTTPAIRAVRNRYPDARIDFVVYDRFSAALAHHPEVDRLFLLPKKKLKEQLARRNFGQFWHTLLDFIADLRSTRYDFIIDLHNVTESALTAILARGRMRAGHKKQLLSLFFKVRSDFDIGFASATMHSAESNLRSLVDAGCLALADLPDKPALEFFVPAETTREVDEYLSQQGLKGKLIMGVNPCASYDYRRWSADRFAAVADFLTETYGCTILLFGAPSEQPTVREVMAAMKSPAVDTTNLTAFRAFELIRRLRLFVTNDSAPMHIAAAMGTPLVALHGPINVKKFAPLSDVARSITKDLPCLPCKKVSECSSQICFDQVTVEEVCLACRELLDSTLAKTA